MLQLQVPPRCMVCLKSGPGWGELKVRSGKILEREGRPLPDMRSLMATAASSLLPMTPACAIGTSRLHLGQQGQIGSPPSRTTPCLEKAVEAQPHTRRKEGAGEAV